MELVGSKDAIDNLYLEENPVPNPFYLKENILTSAEISVTTLIGNSCSLPDGHDYVVSKENGSDVFDHVVENIRCRQTLIPDKFRKTDDNQKGTLIVSTDVIADPAVASLFYLTDAKKKGVYEVKLTCPATISQVKCNAESPVALEFVSNCLVVADASSKKVLVVDLKRQLEITAHNLETLKKGKLQDFADTNIYAAGPQPSKKTKAALICNIKEFLKNTDHKANKLNILNDEIGLPTVLATFQDDILYVADVQ
eukprot:gene21068-23123_t